MLKPLFSIGPIALCAATFAWPAGAAEQPGRKEPPQEKAARHEAAREVRNSVYLGIFTVPLRSVSNRVKKGLQLKDDEGVIVVEVLPESPAAEAGLHEKDAITHANGKTIADQAALCTELNRLGAGKMVTLSILRRGEKRAITARLKETSVEVITFLPYAKPASAADPNESSSRLTRERLRRIRELEREVARLEKKLRDLEEAQLAKKP